MSQSTLLMKQQAILGKDIDTSNDVINVQFVKDGKNGGIDAANVQEQFVLEFDDPMGNANTAVKVAAATAPTKAEFDALVTAYNALATQFNNLIAKMEVCEILQRPNTKGE